LLLFLDAGRQPEPQDDSPRGIKLDGPWPMPLDGFASWESLDRPVNLAWDLRPAEEFFNDGVVAFLPDRTGSYRGVSRSAAASSFVRPASATNGDLLPGPQTLQPPVPLPTTFTIALWAWLTPVPSDEPPHSGGALPRPAPILQLGGGHAVALHVNGLGLVGSQAERVEVPRGRWALLFFIVPHAGGTCKVSGAWDPVGVRPLGSLGILPVGAVLGGFGGKDPVGAGFLSQVAVWCFPLEIEKQREIFAADAARYGCIEESQFNAVRVGELPSRTNDQEAEFNRRLDLARRGSKS